MKCLANIFAKFFPSEKKTTFTVKQISLFPGKSGNKKAAKRLAKDIRQGVERAKTQYDFQDEDQDYNYGRMITKLCFVTLS